MQLKLLLPALCKSPQSGSEETYTSLTKPRTDEGKCVLSALCVACAHTRHSVTAEQRMCCVFWVQPICMCIRLSAQLLPDLLGPLLPCYHTNLSAHLLLLLPLSPLLSLSLPLIRALTASWWMAPRWWGDSSCNCSVSPSLTGRVWGVLFFARGSPPPEVRILTFSSYQRVRPHHPKFHSHLNQCHVKKVDTVSPILHDLWSLRETQWRFTTCMPSDILSAST